MFFQQAAKHLARHWPANVVYTEVVPAAVPSLRAPAANSTSGAGIYMASSAA